MDRINFKLRGMLYLTFVRTNDFEDLVATILKPTNCRSFRDSLPVKHNSQSTASQRVYVYTVVIKSNLVGDSYLRIVKSLHFTSKTRYHRFDYPLYLKSFIQSIVIRLVQRLAKLCRSIIDIFRALKHYTLK
jgi:hypothetical protein